MSPQSADPLHGLTLETILNELVANDPSIGSSLKFLRRTPWAREKVESLYVFMRREQKRQQKEPR